MRKTTLVVLIVILPYLGYLLQQVIKNNAEETYLENIRVAGLFGFPKNITEKHLNIIKNISNINPKYIPAHVMFKEGNEWKLAGTATMLGDQPGYFISAHHVFAAIPGQYGLRKITNKVLSGAEKIYPIIKLSNQTTLTVDDCITGVWEDSDNPPSFINVDSKSGVYLDLDKLPEYQCTAYKTKVRLFTSPTREISTLALISAAGYKTSLILLDATDVVSGESGTGGLITTESQKHIFIVTQIISVREELVKAFGLNPDKRYALGHMVGLP